MPPPEPAGRDDLLSDAKTAIRHTKNPKVSARSLIYVGLRGVGKIVMQRLDANFFRSRYDRLTDIQKLFLRAMAELRDEPLSSGSVAKALGKQSQQVSPIREALIQGGMIYAPKYGQTAFTVPLFGGFMRRTMPVFQI
jgi:hypothetical protein